MAAVMVLCWCLVPGWLSAQPADDLEPYLLKPGDVIDISVWRDEALTHRLAVRPDGMISFPLIGEIRAARSSWTLIYRIIGRWACVIGTNGCSSQPFIYDLLLFLFIQ